VLAAIIGLVLLIIISGFFSSSETGMMATNRYRLQHEAQSGNKRAKQILKLLKRPDRLLGVILIGNTFANIFAGTLATIIAIDLYGETSAFIASLLLTFVVLIFSEVAPKTVAALYPEQTASLVSALVVTHCLSSRVVYQCYSEWFITFVRHSCFRHTT